MLAKTFGFGPARFLIPSCLTSGAAAQIGDPSLCQARLHAGSRLGGAMRLVRDDGLCM